MESQLTALEDKISRVADLCRSLRAENRDLRTRLAAAEEECQRLTGKMEAARSRLETLAHQLPEDPA
jgi:cell division protein ZapB